MSSRAHSPGFWWLWASVVMHNKCNVNQPSRSSTINVISPSPLLHRPHLIKTRSPHITRGKGSPARGPTQTILTRRISQLLFFIFSPSSLLFIGFTWVSETPQLTFQDSHSEEAAVEKLHHGVLRLLALPESKTKGFVVE